MSDLTRNGCEKAAKRLAEQEPVDSLISAEERCSREDAVNSARASVGLEGVKISELGEALAQRYIRGEIEIAAVIKILNLPIKVLNPFEDVANIGTFDRPALLMECRTRGFPSA